MLLTKRLIKLYDLLYILRKNFTLSSLLKIFHKLLLLPLSFLSLSSKRLHMHCINLSPNRTYFYYVSWIYLIFMHKSTFKPFLHLLSNLLIDYLCYNLRNRNIFILIYKLSVLLYFYHFLSYIIEWQFSFYRFSLLFYYLVLFLYCALI